MGTSYRQQVRTVWRCGLDTAGKETERIPLGIGESEVAIILASYIRLYAKNMSNANVRARMWLYRKDTEGSNKATGWYQDSENDGGAWTDDPAVFDMFGTTMAFAAGTGDVGSLSDHLYKVYPFPVVLIRDPSYLFYADIGAVYYEVGLWYVRDKVSDKELAELMVKDHA